MNRPDLLVLVTPWLVVTTWAWLRRPRGRVTVAADVGHGTLREGEATTLRATVTIPDGVDDVVVAVSPSVFLEQDPPLGIRVIGPSEGRPLRDDSSIRRAAAAVVVRSTRWGARPVGPVRCGAWSTWGAYRSGPVDAETQRLVTVPLPAVFTPTAPMPHPEGLVGAYRASRPGSGSEFDRLRPFQVGDRLRRIHWRVSLRTGTLHVTSTYGDEDSLVVLVVDGTSDLGPREGLDGRPTSLDLTVRWPSTTSGSATGSACASSAPPTSRGYPWAAVALISAACWSHWPSSNPRPTATTTASMRSRASGPAPWSSCCRPWSTRPWSTSSHGSARAD
jgi:uncharacterized protein (DUF58 family)